MNLREYSRPDIREVLVDHYRIVYLVGEMDVTILTVFESHRQLR